MHTIIIVSSRKKEEMDMHFQEQLHRLFPGCRIKVVEKYPEESASAYPEDRLSSAAEKEI